MKGEKTMKKHRKVVRKYIWDVKFGAKKKHGDLTRRRRIIASNFDGAHEKAQRLLTATKGELRDGDDVLGISFDGEVYE